MARDSMGGGADSSRRDSSTVVTEQVKQTAQDATTQIQQTTETVANQARQQAEGLIENQKQKASQTLSTLAQALRQTGQNLERQNEAPVGQLVEKAADQIENVNEYLQSHRAEDLVNEVESVGRRNPVLFLGGAFALGVLAARFVKSSPSSSQYGSQGNSYVGGYDRTNTGTYVQTGSQDMYSTMEDVSDTDSGLSGTDATARSSYGA